MSIKLFKKEDSVIRKISDSYSISNYLTIEDSNNVSVAVGNALNHNETTKTESDRVYFILEGEIIINNLKGKSGDILYIPQNTEYSFSGTFKAVIINSPPFKLK
ncbi:hypothetical protein SDC9_146092 [bioreactor metagenome]|uniref:Cupin 2 conserved barrel domain-containing protein n=1 Tax=bioreactor metagenome TaxID=1076179 RepID=A0A645EE74_9ZZZZ